MKGYKIFTLRKTALAAALSIAAAPTLAQLVLEEVVVTAQKRLRKCTGHCRYCERDQRQGH